MSEAAESTPLTEQENPRTAQFSSLPTAEILRLMNEEDARVTGAIAQVLPDIARAIDGIVARLDQGGRLFYIGTGTSGRLGVLDAAECPPTFGVSPERVQGIIAGGFEACYRAVEASEDDAAAGANDLEARGFTNRDALIGIAASGRTPYTVGAVERARQLGGFTVGLTCVPGSLLTSAAEISIVPVVGPEVIAGSTRLKAGTAQKLVLNMISTAAMVRLGYVTGNRMTNVQTRNVKLRARALRILQDEAGLDREKAESMLAEAGDDLPLALVMSKTGRSAADGRRALQETKGVVTRAITLLASE
jgi:N-acetylmuramic acid 6-phosphate etherase